MAQGLEHLLDELGGFLQICPRRKLSQLDIAFGLLSSVTLVAILFEKRPNAPLEVDPILTRGFQGRGPAREGVGRRHDHKQDDHRSPRYLLRIAHEVISEGSGLSFCLASVVFMKYRTINMRYFENAPGGQAT